MSNINNKIIPEWTQEEKNELINTIRENYPVGKIMIAGTRVFGGFNEFSDMDILIINSLDEIWYNRLRKIMSLDFHEIKVKIKSYTQQQAEDLVGTKNERKPWGRESLILSLYDLEENELWEGNPLHEQFRIKQKQIGREQGLEARVAYTLEQFLNELQD